MRRLHWLQLTTLIIIFAVLPAVLSAAQTASAPNDEQLQSAVEKKLADLKLHPPVAVTVRDGVVGVDGNVPTLHAKQRIIELARKTPGVHRVDATLAIPPAESDTKLAQAVSKAIGTYSRLTVFDNVDGRVQNGVVMLSGAVTQPLTRDEITERIANVHGVQDIMGEMKVLPVSATDDRIRNAIARRIYADPDFINYSRAAPPIRIIVENGHVTLIGIVASDLERRKAEIAARGLSGVFSVDNKIHLSSDQSDDH